MIRRFGEGSLPRDQVRLGTAPTVEVRIESDLGDFRVMQIGD